MQHKYEDKKWSAIKRRDKSYNSVFYYGVLTTGVFCDPPCPSRQPNKENV
jgi:methylphosphotriester-DNA--protein-cysteine methyltransferase